MITFYENNNFKLFPCNMDKSPKVDSWRASAAHLKSKEADRIMSTGGFIGAWIPENFLIIDVDMNHKDKEGNKKPEGLPEFEKLCRELDITDDLIKKTLTVKTGSGGYHLYFKLPENTDYKTLSQKSIAESVDVRTHLGYVIACGTNGYSIYNKADVMIIPESLLKKIQTRNKDKAKSYTPKKELSVSVLSKILKDIDVKNFSSNDSWQEFITSCIAVCGNTEEVINELEDWSRADVNYKNDKSVRTRIETFEPDGGITAGTFLYILKKEKISKYMIDKIRMEIGAQFSIAEKFSENFECPFKVNYSLIREHFEIMKAFYYTKNQAAGVKLFAELSKENLIYSHNEKCFYYFDGNRWEEITGILNIIFSVLVQACQNYYTDFSKKNDADADDYISSVINFISSLSMRQRFESALKQYPDLFKKNVPWDSPLLEGTLTLTDCVMDFSGKDEIIFRKGEKSEYRRLFLNLSEEDFKNKKLPENFRSFLKDVFPDAETRKTATYALSTMLSGTGKFRKFQIWNGAGSNGKSTLMELMKYIIGQRAISYKADILLNKLHTASLTPELAVFRGSLVAFASETEESKRVSQGAVKALTGNETMTANPKYQGMIEFKTTFQLVLATNYLPTFSAHDAAFINRVLILPFYTNFYKDEEEKERAKSKGSRHFKKALDVREIEENIKKERPQILYYLAKRYQELDHVIPESRECLDAKSHYVDDNNDIIQFLNEFCEFSIEPENKIKYYFTPTKELTDFYNSENNTRYSSKFVIMRLKEVFNGVETVSKMINGKLVRGLKNIRLKYGAYPEGYMGNFTQEEIDGYVRENAGY